MGEIVFFALYSGSDYTRVKNDLEALLGKVYISEPIEAQTENGPVRYVLGVTTRDTCTRAFGIRFGEQLHLFTGKKEWLALTDGRSPIQDVTVVLPKEKYAHSSLPNPGDLVPKNDYSCFSLPSSFS